MDLSITDETLRRAYNPSKCGPHTPSCEKEHGHQLPNTRAAAAAPAFIDVPDSMMVGYRPEPQGPVTGTVGRPSTQEFALKIGRWREEFANRKALVRFDRPPLDILSLADFIAEHPAPTAARASSLLQLPVVEIARTALREEDDLMSLIPQKHHPKFLRFVHSCNSAATSKSTVSADKYFVELTEMHLSRCAENSYKLIGAKLPRQVARSLVAELERCVGQSRESINAVVQQHGIIFLSGRLPHPALYAPNADSDIRDEAQSARDSICYFNRLKFAAQCLCQQLGLPHALATCLTPAEMLAQHLCSDPPLGGGPAPCQVAAAASMRLLSRNEPQARDARGKRNKSRHIPRRHSVDSDDECVIGHGKSPHGKDYVAGPADHVISPAGDDHLFDIEIEVPPPANTPVNGAPRHSAGPVNATPGGSVLELSGPSVQVTCRSKHLFAIIVVASVTVVVVFALRLVSQLNGTHGEATNEDDVAGVARVPGTLPGAYLLSLGLLRLNAYIALIPMEAGSIRSFYFGGVALTNLICAMYSVRSSDSVLAHLFLQVANLSFGTDLALSGGLRRVFEMLKRCVSRPATFLYFAVSFIGLLVQHSLCSKYLPLKIEVLASVVAEEIVKGPLLDFASRALPRPILSRQDFGLFFGCMEWLMFGSASNLAHFSYSKLPMGPRIIVHYLWNLCCYRTQFSAFPPQTLFGLLAGRGRLTHSFGEAMVANLMEALRHATHGPAGTVILSRNIEHAVRHDTSGNRRQKLAWDVARAAHHISRGEPQMAMHIITHLDRYGTFEAAQYAVAGAPEIARRLNDGEFPTAPRLSAEGIARARASRLILPLRVFPDPQVDYGAPAAAAAQAPREPPALPQQRARALTAAALAAQEARADAPPPPLQMPSGSASVLSEAPTAVISRDFDDDDDLARAALAVFDPEHPEAARPRRDDRGIDFDARAPAPAVPRAKRAPAPPPAKGPARPLGPAPAGPAPAPPVPPAAPPAVPGPAPVAVPPGPVMAGMYRVFWHNGDRAIEHNVRMCRPDTVHPARAAQPTYGLSTLWLLRRLPAHSGVQLLIALGVGGLALLFKRVGRLGRMVFLFLLGAAVARLSGTIRKRRAIYIGLHETDPPVVVSDYRTPSGSRMPLIPAGPNDLLSTRAYTITYYTSTLALLANIIHEIVPHSSSRAEHVNGRLLMSHLTSEPAKDRLIFAERIATHVVSCNLHVRPCNHTLDRSYYHRLALEYFDIMREQDHHTLMTQHVGALSTDVSRKLPVAPRADFGGTLAKDKPGRKVVAFTDPSLHITTQLTGYCVRPTIPDKSNTHSVIMGCAQRNGCPLPPHDATEAALWSTVSAAYIRKYFVCPRDPIPDIREHKKNYTSSRFRRVCTNLLSPDLDLSEPLKGFPKHEGWAEFKFPRSIIAAGDERSVLWCGYEKAIEKAGYATAPTSHIKNVDIRHLAERLDDLFADEPTNHTDFSSFERHHAGHLLTPGLEIFKILREQSDFPIDIIDMFEQMYKDPNVVRMAGTTFCIGATLWSGAEWTAFFNWLLNQMLLAYLRVRTDYPALRNTDEIVSLMYASKRLAEGDDGVGAGGPYDRALIAALGLDLVIEEHPNVRSGRFCSMLTAGNGLLLTDPMKVLIKFCTLHPKFGLAKMSTKMGYFRAKALSLKAMYPHAPIIGPFADHVLYLTRSHDHRKYAEEAKSWLGRDLVLESTYPPAVVTMAAREVIELEFGIPAAEQVQFEQSLVDGAIRVPDQWCNLPVLAELERLDLLGPTTDGREDRLESIMNPNPRRPAPRLIAQIPDWIRDEATQWLRNNPMPSRALPTHERQSHQN